MSSPHEPETITFLLGTQRSGSTWLANIFDASPDTLLFMEPFAPTYGVFPEFPHASEFVEEATPRLTRLLREDMPRRLMKYKTMWFRESLFSPEWFRRDRWVARQLRRYGVGGMRDHANRFELLNLNRLNEGFPGYGKRRHPTHWAIKELRLAGKLSVVTDAYPHANFVVIIRHPAATVYSILRWFERGGLAELKSDLDTYVDRLAAQPAGRPYSKQIAACRRGGVAHVVALYWRVSYETMIKRLEGNPSARILVYEQLASDPERTAREVFEQTGVVWSDSQAAYMSHSTKGGDDPESPIETRRDSTTYYCAWTEKIDDKTRTAVGEITGESHLLEYFAPFYS